MKVTSITVDEIPESCEKCYLRQHINDQYHCIPLMAEIRSGVNFMRHDCPLRKDESQKAKELGEIVEEQKLRIKNLSEIIVQLIKIAISSQRTLPTIHTEQIKPLPYMGEMGRFY